MFAEASERRISFSTNEEDSSPRGSHDTIDEAGLHTDKKGSFFLSSANSLIMGLKFPILIFCVKIHLPLDFS